MLVALAWLYPHAFADANRSARANARLDNIDRALGGGNSVLPAQAIAMEARGRIPEDGTFAVSVGPRQPGWSVLAIPDSVAMDWVGMTEFPPPTRRSTQSRRAFARAASFACANDWG